MIIDSSKSVVHVLLQWVKFQRNAWIILELTQASVKHLNQFSERCNTKDSEELRTELAWNFNKWVSRLI